MGKALTQYNKQLDLIIKAELEERAYIYNIFIVPGTSDDAYKTAISSYLDNKEKRERDLAILLDQEEREHLATMSPAEILEDVEAKTRGAITLLCARIEKGLTRADRKNKDLIVNLRGAYFKKSIDGYIEQTIATTPSQTPPKYSFKLDSIGTRDYIMQNVLKNHYAALNNEERRKLENTVNRVLDNSPFILFVDPEEQTENLLLTSDTLLFYHGQVTDLTINPPSDVNLKGWSKETKNGLFECMTNDICNFRVGNVKTHQLFLIAIALFTRQNRKGHSQNLTVKIPVKEYIFLGRSSSNGDTIDSLEEDRRRYERDKKYITRNKKNLAECMDILKSRSISLTEKAKGKLKRYAAVNYFSSVYFSDGDKNIVLNFTDEMGQLLSGLTLASFPLKLLTFGETEKTAYMVGYKLMLIATSKNNIVRGNANRISVSKLLAATDIVTIEELDRTNDSRHWERRIKRRLEEALKKNMYITISSWHYEDKNETIEFHATKYNYSDFERLLIVFDYIHPVLQIET